MGACLRVCGPAVSEHLRPGPLTGSPRDMWAGQRSGSSEVSWRPDCRPLLPPSLQASSLSTEQFLSLCSGSRVWTARPHLS